MKSRGSVFLSALVAVCALSIAFLAFGGFALHRWWKVSFPAVSRLSNEYPLIVYRPSAKGQKFEIKWQRNRPPQWVSLHAIPRPVQGAFIVSEDWAFYQHQGFDPAQIKDAAVESWKKGRYTRGASTITQQMVKNVFLNQDRTLWRKLREILLAVEAEKNLGKKKILETYLNIVEFGEGLYGIQPASRFYFGRPVNELSGKEAAFLAMLLPSPKKYAVSFRKKELTPFARQQVRSILGKMVQAGFLARENMLEQARLPLAFERVFQDTVPSSLDKPEDSGLYPDEQTTDLTDEIEGNAHEVPEEGWVVEEVGPGSGR